MLQYAELLLLQLLYLNEAPEAARLVPADYNHRCFAFLDEVHQAFIIGRDGRIVDVLIDSFGGALFLFLLYKNKTKHRRAKRNEYSSSIKK
ncbi:VanZ family protein [Priestia megaterium]|uniref:VanZ family protein n=1 Tax=Priestia megaterium TaxID=1404 RepID=UPI00234F360F|nr:VanZ family protein [Priestia megaterium]MDC7778948.1 VanZ family protein [Priestia megaterium]